MNPQHYHDALQSELGGHKWILIGGPLAGLVSLRNELERYGVQRPFVLGSGVGTGPLPSAEQAECFALDVHGENIVDGMRVYESLLGMLPEPARAALDAWDPHGEARVISRLQLGSVPEVAGRPRFGARPDEWIALEDKCAVDAFFDAAGVRRAESRIVGTKLLEQWGAHQELDRGLGSVWAGDSREGANGGAVYVRWIGNKSEAKRAHDWFEPRCHRVRVSPFLAGVPCSIHGFVAAGEVAVFRPVEMGTLRKAQTRELVYAGFGTSWDPDPEGAEAMRSAARAAGRLLRDAYDFRGSYTVDGIYTAEGFQATELNPRVGGALSLLEEASGVPLILLSNAAVERVEIDWRLDELEQHVVRAANEKRCGTTSGSLMGEHEARSIELVLDGAQLREVREGEEPMGTLALGPGIQGGFLRFGARPGAPTPGVRWSEVGCKVLDYCRESLGISMPSIESMPMP